MRLLYIVAFIILLSLGVSFDEQSEQCSTDMECYSLCMDNGGKPEDCEYGLTNP
jgi:hypothetical protein